MASFRLGLHLTNLHWPDLPRQRLLRRLVEVAVAAERAGFDSIWLPEHTIQQPPGGGPTAPALDPYVTLGALAAVTDRVQLGALVTPVTFRAPALLAKTVATLDVLSGGRAVLGIGAGWIAGEHHAYGIDFPPIAERQDRLEEAVQVCRAMLDAPAAGTFAGRYYRIADAVNQPTPIQSRIPILIGGSGEQRTLRAVARYADACNINGDRDTVGHKLEVLARHCHEIDRDPTEIVTTTALAPHDGDGYLTQAADYLEVGVNGLILLTTTCPDVDTIASWGQAVTSTFPALRSGRQ